MPALRLTRLIREEVERLGSLHRLSKEIEDANHVVAEKGSIHERTLRRIRDHPEDVKLNLSNFIALDNYFAPRGEGLRDKPLFDRRGVLEHMAEPRSQERDKKPDSPSVTFLVGAKPRTREKRTDLIFWDTRAFAELTAPLTRLGVNSEIVDVLLRPVSDLKDLHKESWHRLIHRSDRNLIAIGSPRACLATESILAELFEIEAFERPRASLLKAPLPFGFAWPAKMMRGFRSAFALTPDDVARKSPKLAPLVQRGTHGVFYLGNEPHPVPLSGDRGHTYGVIAAQRRSTGRILMVVCGFTGPATYAAATRVEHIHAELPHVPDEDAPVLWIPIRADFRSDSGVPGDSRRVGKITRLAPPQIWPPRTRLSRKD